MSLNVSFHTWVNIGSTNINLFLFEVFFKDNTSLNMNARNRELYKNLDLKIKVIEAKREHTVYANDV